MVRETLDWITLLDPTIGSFVRPCAIILLQVFRIRVTQNPPSGFIIMATIAAKV
jgi:hypothetical protein